MSTSTMKLLLLALFSLIPQSQASVKVAVKFNSSSSCVNDEFTFVTGAILAASEFYDDMMESNNQDRRMLGLRGSRREAEVTARRGLSITPATCCAVCEGWPKDHCWLVAPPCTRQLLGDCKTRRLEEDETEARLEHHGLRRLSVDTEQCQEKTALINRALDRLQDSLSDSCAAQIGTGQRIFDCYSCPTETSEMPSTSPSMAPSMAPSNAHSQAPSVSVSPTSVLSETPTETPSVPPSSQPSMAPSNAHSQAPSVSVSPTSAPSETPTETPSVSPSSQPSMAPSNAHSQAPSVSASPTDTHSEALSTSASPTTGPSQAASASPTATPTTLESQAPSANPTSAPTDSESQAPSANPTATPTTLESQAPSANPTSAPTDSESQAPSANPTATPTTLESQAPSANPTPEG